MITNSLSVARWAGGQIHRRLRGSESHETDIETFLAGHIEPSATHLYGSGKAALSDGVEAILRVNNMKTDSAPSGNVLIPTYIPDAVASPFAEHDLEVRFYRIEPDLGPNIDDLRSRIDRKTVAVMAVNYFGFSPPRYNQLTALAANARCPVIEDNAHSPLTVIDGRLGGTRGDIGITSLWKQFSVPDGAVLYTPSERIRAELQPSAFAGVMNRFGLTDCRYALTATARDLATTHRKITGPLQATLVAPKGQIPSSTERYEAGKVPMAKLSQVVLSDINPDRIRRRRRQNYRIWLRALTDHPTVNPIFPTLPTGICPAYAPVMADSPDAFKETLSHAHFGTIERWPRLPTPVHATDSYETATRLAEHVLLLPVHQQIRPSRLERALACLARTLR